jgi:hypothetical protein
VKQQSLVEEIIKAIDVSEAPDGTPLGNYNSSGPYLKVYSVSGADAREITKSLDAMMPGVVINEDSRAGRIHIWGTTKQHEQVAEWIQQFDGRGGSGSVAVIPLVRMDPLTASSTLRSLFLKEGDAAPTIETEFSGRRLIVRGTAEQIAQIKTVLAELGEDGTGIRKSSEGGPVRRFSLQGRNPEEFLRFLQQSWEASERNPIRIIVPGSQGPIRDRRTPSAPERNPERNPENNERTERPSRHSSSVTEHSDPVSRLMKQLLTSAPGNEQSNDGGNEDGKSDEDLNDEAKSNSFDDSASVETSDAGTSAEDAVRILLNGDELILSSSDEAALDRMEEMLDALQQSLPNRVTWTVFYLQAADATETATMLEQIFPASSVTNSAANSGFSISGMFRPVTDTVSSLTGISGLQNSPQTLRIIPDIRSNSLFVSGPEMLIRDVEEVLKVLDASDLPESLREMQPRMIEVRYADIEEVAKIVNDVFKPYIEAPAAARQQNNPFAALMGGGGKGGNESAQVRMTVGVDMQTSSLIVSSSESLFTQVQELVGSLDDASRSANRQVRVVQLKNADAAQVQESLTSLFPRVRSSVTRSTTGGATDSAAARGDGSNRGDRSDRGNNANQQDAFQQMMQERMRQRAAEMNGGNSGGNGGRGNRGGGFPFGGAGTPFGGGNNGNGGRGGGRNGR